MQRALSKFQGTHDFRNFTRIRDVNSDNYTRTISHVSLETSQLYSQDTWVMTV